MSANGRALQDLKYRPLSEVSGRRVTIAAFDEIEKTLLHEMAHALPASAQFILENDPASIAMLMAKYGALDLTFVASTPVLTAADTITLEGLIKLCLAERDGTLGDEFEWVERNLSETTCFLRVFLTWVLPSEAMDLRNEQAKLEIAKGVPRKLAHDSALDFLAEHIGERFPLVLTIDDACLTNSKSIWVGAHFYL